MASTRPGFAAAFLALLLLGAPIPALAQTGSKCSALKMKAAGAYLKAQARCRAKTIQKGLASDQVCLVEASDQLARAISKAERRGDCLALEVDLPASTALEDAGEDVSQIIAPTCCSMDTFCTWLSEARCLGQSGTPGAPRTVCGGGGSGACGPPPAAAGGCCEQVGVFGNPGRTCVASVTDTLCQLAGGTHFPDQVCLASRGCGAP